MGSYGGSIIQIPSPSLNSRTQSSPLWSGFPDEAISLNQGSGTPAPFNLDFSPEDFRSPVGA